MSELDFQKIFASGASSQIDWTDDNYLKGWGYLGNVPPSYQSFDSLQRLNDLKFKYLYDEFMGIETNTEELISNHNENSEAHKTLFDKKLDKNGGTVTGNLNASGHNITATKFIGNLQGKADSAANADLAAKATTAENANNANNSSVANKLGTSTVGSATKPVYINNGVASAVSVDLSTLAPKESPGLTGTPTAPTANVDTNDTQIATCGFVRNAIAKYAPMLDTMKKIYPVGSIYISTVSTNPSELFGFGTWEAMPAGRVLLAQGKVETENYTHNFVAGETGGEFVHQLTVGELPSHGHTASTDTININGGFRLDGTEVGGTTSASGVFSIGSSFTPSKGHGNSGGGSNAGRNINFNSTHSHKITINNVGEGQSHNNIQPYLTVYMWKRVS
jgi:microcystin-dependent protein